MKGSLGKTGEEMLDSYKVGTGNMYESMEEYLPPEVNQSA